PSFFAGWSTLTRPAWLAIVPARSLLSRPSSVVSTPSRVSTASTRPPVQRKRPPVNVPTPARRPPGASSSCVDLETVNWPPRVTTAWFATVRLPFPANAVPSPTEPGAISRRSFPPFRLTLPPVLNETPERTTVSAPVGMSGVATDLDQRRADRQAAVVRDQRAERVVGRAVDRACGRTAEEDGRVERAAAPAEGLRHVDAAALDRGRPGEGERAEVDVVAELDLRRRLPGDVGEDGVVVGRPRARVLLLALVLRPPVARVRPGLAVALARPGEAPAGRGRRGRAERDADRRGGDGEAC